MTTLNVLLILLLLTVFTGVVMLVDWFYLRHRRRQQATEGVSSDTGSLQSTRRPTFIDYCFAFFPVFLIVLLIRAFLFQPYRVPSGSLEPTVMPGDLILVSQYNYGLHLPVWNTQLLATGQPKRGDIVLFRWPVNPKVTFVKRLIGLPGDHISYIDKVLYINGHKATQRLVGHAIDRDTKTSPSWPVDVYEENLLGVQHKIYICPPTSTQCPGVKPINFYNLVVPKGMYFMMGDNRDNSGDSRSWGFVLKNALIGRAKLIWFSTNPFSSSFQIRWDRIGINLVPQRDKHKNNTRQEKE